MKDATASDNAEQLQARHRELAEEVRQLEKRAYLTPEEQRHITELKKQKLAAKDQLFGLKPDE
jgi:uncharacterized protein YdcH (DUF465 family)